MSSATSNITCSVGPNEDACYYPTPESLENAYQTGNCNVKILLLSHPNNPLGICYPKKVLRDILIWAESRSVHIISDEIYGGSCYNESKNTGENFTSMLTVASEHRKSTCSDELSVIDTSNFLGIGPYVHLVYGLSKDLALSGLRVGVAYTENKDVALPMSKLNDLCQVSSQTLVLLDNLFTRRVGEYGNDIHDIGSCHNDTAISTSKNYYWDEYFLMMSRKRLSNRSCRLQNCLTNCQIPFLKPDSAMFIWMDLSKFLPQELASSFSKRTLYLELINVYGLLLTPELSMKMTQPGYFRFFFTAATEDQFELPKFHLNRFATTCTKMH
uniref:Aminotransferase class I/classII large domain-containing protein n=1 Tax=Proboscia inermis TaxID=420281 RepID=A0A7S0GJW4_9STRA|mmetsp:Transcript_42988/g.43594  ORF Transcript_42988/g.43594 Transcript_42988/m.43594 type:complete len:328 (+) Transcript_42988:99-1082(+)